MGSHINFFYFCKALNQKHCVIKACVKTLFFSLWTTPYLKIDMTRHWAYVREAAVNKIESLASWGSLILGVGRQIINTQAYMLHQVVINYKEKRNKELIHTTILMMLENIIIMWMKADTKGYNVRFHLYEITRVGKPIKRKSKLVMFKNWGKGEWEVTT